MWGTHLSCPPCGSSSNHHTDASQNISKGRLSFVRRITLFRPFLPLKTTRQIFQHTNVSVQKHHAICRVPISLEIPPLTMPGLIKGKRPPFGIGCYKTVRLNAFRKASASAICNTGYITSTCQHVCMSAFITNNKTPLLITGWDCKGSA